MTRLAPRVRLGDSPAVRNAASPDWFSPPECSRWEGLGAIRKGSFLGSRILMRGLLADELGRHPNDWPLDGRGHPLQFDGALRTSISHHSDRAAAALCCDSQGLGIDLERPHRRCRWNSIAGRWFSPTEQTLLAAHEPAAGERLFYRLWTLKEAWVKATGRGLAGHFQAIGAVPDGSGWRLEADTHAEGWQAWSGWVGPDCLAVIWQGKTPGEPRLETAALCPEAGCTDLAPLAATDAVQIAITPAGISSLTE